MKRVLVIGSGSFIAKAFVEAAGGKLEVHAIPGRGEIWRETDFTGYDALLLCAGLAHIRQTPQNRHLYNDINRHMAVDIAMKGKASGVGQFVFLSSMSVYGQKKGVITADTQPNPERYDWYGMSKWNAERGLTELIDSRFTLTILRPPMVYGRDCPGNFPRLFKLARSVPFFPLIENKRSMIFSENLAMLLCALIEEGRGGVFCPQNKDPVCTSDLVRYMGEAAGRPVRFTKVFNLPVRLVARILPSAGKLFNDCYYHPDLSIIPGIEYQRVGLKASVERSIQE